jgi:hypothetical protein
MKKGQTSKAAPMYIRKVRKDWRKHGFPSAAQQAEAAAKIDQKFASLKAKAEELPKLKAEKRWVKNEIERFYRDVTIIASCVSPGLFAGGPNDVRAAIKLALKRIQDTKRYFAELKQQDKENEKKALAKAEEAELRQVRKGYEKAVKLVTNEFKDIGRAMPKWRRYVEAKRVFTGSSLEKVLAQYQKRWDKDGWTLLELRHEISIFDPWWRQEKLDQKRRAAQSRNRGKSKPAKKRGPGRVKRRASDLRFKENRRHKQGYCQVCGKRVGDRQLRCDEHIKSKVLSFSTGTNDLAEFARGDPRKHGVIPII